MRSTSMVTATQKQTSDRASISSALLFLKFRTRNLFIVCVALSISALWVSYRPPALASDFADSYALCSREGSKIYTVDAQNTAVECIHIRNGFVHDVGQYVQLNASWSIQSGKLPVRYLPEGAVVIPGISDSHVHMLEYGASRLIPLEEAKNIPDVVGLVKQYVLENPDVYKNRSKTIEGWGWDHTIWPASGWPDASDFDRDPVTQGRPIILRSKDGHAIWVSSTTLKANSPFPEQVEGGLIVRDAAGKPKGVFLDTAQDLIAQPSLTQQDLRRRFMVAAGDALAAGLTSVHDAGFQPKSLELFRSLAHQHDLPLRVYAMTFFDDSANASYWGNTTKPFTDEAKGRLTAMSVKMFGDGALRTGGAALYEPYSDNPSSRGAMRLSHHALGYSIPQFLKDGWQVNVHAIGDRANGLVIDAFEKAAREYSLNIRTLRPRLEHAEIITPDDAKRLGALGVIASVQPTHVTDDMWYAQDRLGPERIKNLYPFRSLLNAGTKLIIGTDFPVEGVNPLASFYSAITRVDADGNSPHGPGGWFPDQKLTRIEALRGMTIDPAYASFSESKLGSLEAGKIADFVVLSKDIMTVPEKEILDTLVIATVLDGKPAYGAL